MSDQPQENAQAQGADGLGGRSLKHFGSSEDRRRKRSSVYVYLVVLFGAAFLMLLLAYFVQQRNNESAMSDLRSSMNLSREELMEEIDALKQDKESLQQENEQLSGQVDGLQTENSSLDAQLATERAATEEWKDRAEVLTAMAVLEQAIRDGDYEIAAQRTRLLCRGEWELDLGIADLEGRVHFDPRERLAELIPLLEQEGALEPGELSIP